MVKYLDQTVQGYPEHMPGILQIYLETFWAAYKSIAIHEMECIEGIRSLNGKSLGDLFRVFFLTGFWSVLF